MLPQSKHKKEKKIACKERIPYASIGGTYNKQRIVGKQKVPSNK
jgi:hypothetical protein